MINGIARDASPQFAGYTGVAVLLFDDPSSTTTIEGCGVVAGTTLKRRAARGQRRNAYSIIRTLVETTRIRARPRRRAALISSSSIVLMIANPVSAVAEAMADPP
jgi:hypothetical protein